MEAMNVFDMQQKEAEKQKAIHLKKVRKEAALAAKNQQ